MQKLLYHTANHQCKSVFQDNLYGPGKRVCILKDVGLDSAAIFTCTVCGQELFSAPSFATRQAKRQKAAAVPGGKGNLRFWYE